MSTASESTSSFPTDEHPYVTLAKKIANTYLRMTYALNPETDFDFEFELVDSLWTWGRWTVDLRAEIDGLIYRVLHNGETGEVTDVIEFEQEKEQNG